jgi:hypothetical protein
MPPVDLLDWLPAWTKVLLDLRVTTLVIAIATVVNVVVAFVMWGATKMSGDAAKESARAAVRSAAAGEHMIAAAYRPYFAVSKVAAVDLADQAKAHVLVTLKNYGSVPLRFTNYRIELVVATADLAQPAHHELFGAPATSVVLPGDKARFRCGLSQQWLYTVIHSGDVSLTVEVRVPYTSLAANQEYEFRSEHRYLAAPQLFHVVTSTMT